MEYVAIKVKSLDHWLWFETKKVSEEHGTFQGIGGWGKGGAMTSIEVDSGLIKGRILSNSLQYENQREPT